MIPDFLPHPWDDHADKPPERLVISTGASNVHGPRAAWTRGRECWRQKPDGSLDWVTVHWTKRGARKAAELYERSGEVKGHQP